MDKRAILVWDAPLRVFHWLFAASFAGAFLTAEAERYRDVHVILGYAFAGLLAFRLAWAVVGTRHARLSSFAFGPAAVIRYLRSLAAWRPPHYVGHNPAGSWAIYALLLLGAAVAATGYAVHADAGGHWLEDVHEAAANAMLAVVIVHVAGVVVGSLAHRENLARAMLTGYKRGAPDQAIPSARWPVALLLVAGVAVLAVGVGADPGLADRGRHEAKAQRHDHEGDRRARRADGD